MNEGNFLWMLIVVVTAIANLVSLLFSLRRRPPVSEELYKDFLAKSDHEAMCLTIKGRFETLDNHNTKTHELIFETIRQNQKSLQQDFQTLERGLGRVEGKLDGVVKGNS